MNIGIDIDGVLTNSELLTKITRFRIQHDKKVMQASLETSLQKIPKPLYDVAIFALLKYFQRTKPQKFSRRIIHKLKKEGNKIFIITNRPTNIPFGALIKKETYFWLKKNGIEFNKLIFANQRKSEIVKEYNIQILIDDSINIVDENKNSTKTIYFCNFHSINDSKIIIAKNWLDVCKIIHNKKSFKGNDFVLK